MCQGKGGRMEGIQPLYRFDAALIGEKRIIDFFLEQAKHIRNPLGKAVFRDIAEKVRGNFRQLYRLRRRRANKGLRRETDPGDSVVMEVGDEEDFESILSGDIDRALAEYDDCTIIETASSLIDKASAYFFRFGEQLNDPAERELFRSIAGMKREYFLNLRDIEEYLKDPASWFAELEHHGLDGA